MRVLMTAAAHARHGYRLEGSGVEPVLLASDGSLRLGDGEPLGRDEAAPEVAWGTSDLYAEGAPLRPFFGLVRRAAGLRWFQSPAAGFDNPVFAELLGRGVRVSNAHVNSIPIAEFVLRSVLDVFQEAGRWRAAEAVGEWRAHDYREVHGTTWLIFGLGSIGSEVGMRARAFGATVFGCRRRSGPHPAADRVVRPDELRSVVGDADVVVLSAPATASTRNLVDASFLASMADGSVLVNVARGALVDEEALLAALEAGRPSHAVLDVFVEEPLPTGHPFWAHPRVTVTAHNAAGGPGRHHRQADLFVANLARYRSGQPLLNELSEADLGG